MSAPVPPTSVAARYRETRYRRLPKLTPPTRQHVRIDALSVTTTAACLYEFDGDLLLQKGPELQVDVGILAKVASGVLKRERIFSGQSGVIYDGDEIYSHHPS